MSIIDTIISLVFPAREEVRALEQLTPAMFYEKTGPPRAELPPSVYACCSYKCTAVQQCIWLLKYEGNVKIAKLLARTLYDTLIETLADELMFSYFSDPILIPLPSSKQRQRERGWSQTDMLAKELCALDASRSFACRTDILVKIRHTPAQAKLSERERKENLRNSFAVTKAGRGAVKRRNIVLLDDVTTTGSTFLEASKPLLEAGARRVMCFAVAH